MNARLRLKETRESYRSRIILGLVALVLVVLGALTSGQFSGVRDPLVEADFARCMEREGEPVTDVTAHVEAETKTLLGLRYHVGVHRVGMPILVEAESVCRAEVLRQFGLTES